MTLALKWDPEAQSFDLDFDETGHLRQGDALETAVAISLFTNARAVRTRDGQPVGAASGWWGDSFNDRPIGSKLWTHARGLTTQAELRQLQVELQQALAWLRDDGVAKAVEVTVSRSASNREAVEIAVQITRGDGTKWSRAWGEVLPSAI